MVSRVEWPIDPEDPRAPPSALWASMSDEERASIAAALPSDIAGPPPEGDPHFRPKVRARATIERWFAQQRRKVYVGCELPVYYPAERVFAPDVFAVLDVEPRERERWLVDHEQRGLDWILEILVSGARRKDLETNVERYARLAIPEYFVFDRPRKAIRGFQLGAGGGRYQPIVPQRGRLASSVLGLELGVVDGRLQFFVGDVELPDTEELIERLERACDEINARVEEEAQRADEEAQRADEQARRADEERERREAAEERLRAAEELIARLRGG